jgi:hypothetical protein
MGYRKGFRVLSQTQDHDWRFGLVRAMIEKACTHRLPTRLNPTGTSTQWAMRLGQTLPHRPTSGWAAVANLKTLYVTTR